ncbi:hypothetical protein Q5P01_021844 [Channa striata]|uniref:Uncharacterized protein n=1 Tax=Channa striata TaxID=64152 RepID=A0AA88LUU3_CHASR|nr:hypothetical protein Q5P01_021844 [Channa striata]
MELIDWLKHCIFVCGGDGLSIGDEPPPGERSLQGFTATKRHHAARIQTRVLQLLWGWNLFQSWFRAKRQR